VQGVETPDGHVGLITYMRTDSVAIAGVAMGEARDVIRERFGEPYTMPKGRVYKTKTKGAQEAHESIRPTSFRRDPDSLARFLKPEELRLYRLIWQRALASQMEAKELQTTTAELRRAVRAARLGDPDVVRRLRPRVHGGARRGPHRRGG
jgi:DNA topoisomerase-1